MDKDLLTGYLLLGSTDVFSEELCDKIRARLKVTPKQLPSKVIRKTTNLSNRLIGEWMIVNKDGFEIKNNGVLAVSKYMPPSLRLCKDDTLQSIQEDPAKPQYMKDMLTKRIEKAMELRKNFSANSVYTNAHSFFYTYKVMWFNKKNCNFDKATVYEFEASRWIDNAIFLAVTKGRDFIEWVFTDFHKKSFKRKK